MPFCGNPSRYWLPHHDFKDFHTSFHNFRKIVRNLRLNSMSAYMLKINRVRMILVGIHECPELGQFTTVLPWAWKNQLEFALSYLKKRLHKIYKVN